MRILMVATEYPPARGYGLARYAGELSRVLASAGNEVHVINANCSASKPDFDENGICVHELKSVHPVKHYHWVGDSLLGNVHLLERGLEITAEHGSFDVIISHDWLGSLAAQSLRQVLGAPWLLCMHDTEPGKRDNKLSPEQVYIAEVETWACERADAIVANSNFIAEELARFHKVPSEKIQVVHPGVDAGGFETDGHIPDFKALFAGKGEKLVLYLGRLSPMKGIDLLFDAMPEILQKCAKTKFMIAGDGVLREKLTSRARELGVAEHVRFVGHLSGKVLGAAYRAADLVVIPSRYEPFGMVALEAMSLGTPVLAAGTGGLKEIVRDKGGTRIFKPNDSGSIAKSVISALKRRFTSKAREKLIAYACEYSWEKCAQAVLNVCNKLISQKAQR
jgi:glycosyltransferase involved in cell wall biosynthesis